jgi:hypothetical protein
MKLKLDWFEAQCYCLMMSTSKLFQAENFLRGHVSLNFELFSKELVLLAVNAVKRVVQEESRFH